MDQNKIGKFISTTRKEQNLTQRKLADELGISDKTVSKWECGKGLPEVSLMLPLCEALKINVNELLSGEKLSDKNYNKKAEENMMSLLKEKEENKKKIIISMAIVVLCMSVMLVCTFLAGFAEGLTTTTRIFLVVFGAIVTIAGIVIAIVLDRDAGTYECRKCHQRFTPDMKSYVLAPHTITTRRLKCPHCGESSYSKRRLTK